MLCLIKAQASTVPKYEYPKFTTELTNKPQKLLILFAH
uniref:Uncharacterized protein n=1 Tax=Arundo donax TaxID=35708 RepID=A0A0A9B5Y8_ARUDO